MRREHGAVKHCRIGKRSGAGVGGADATAPNGGCQPPGPRRDVVIGAVVHLPAEAATSQVTDTTRVAFYPLSMRRDDAGWVVGRIDTGDFALMPEVARRAIALLSGGRTVGEAARELQLETGRHIAVADFVTDLDGLGFLTAIDGRARHGPTPVRASLPWLRPRHLRWLLHPVVPWLVLLVVAAAAVMAIAEPAILPGYRALVWSRHSGLVLVIDTAIGWTLVWLHELGHLATARAAGVPARLSLGTRLQFLVAQTDVSGVWAAPRRVRLTVYLAGIAIDLLVASACLLTIGLAHPAGLVHRILALVALEAVLFEPWELLIFMRTDVYYLIQDLAGCANLYADGSARVRYLARRIRRLPGRRGSGVPAEADPSRALPPRERRAVRGYGWLLLCGTAGCLAVAACVTVPAAIALVAHAIGELSSSSAASQADGATAIVAVGGVQVLWLQTWWRGHESQVRAYLRTRCQRPAEGR
jgi:putative peptide zinc metalloprotease protein